MHCASTCLTRILLFIAGCCPIIPELCFKAKSLSLLLSIFKNYQSSLGTWQLCFVNSNLTKHCLLCPGSIISFYTFLLQASILTLLILLQLDCLESAQCTILCKILSLNSSHALEDWREALELENRHTECQNLYNEVSISASSGHLLGVTVCFSFSRASVGSLNYFLDLCVSVYMFPESTVNVWVFKTWKVFNRRSE